MLKVVRGTLPVRRFIIGSFFLLHGAAHAVVGIRPHDVLRHPPGGTGSAGAFAASALFAIAFGCFAQAGLGAWGLVGLRQIWRPLARIGVAAYALLLFFFITPSLRFAIGIFLDVGALLLADPRLLVTGRLAPTRP